MSRFDIAATPIPGVMAVKRQRLGDTRGFLSRLFCAAELADAGWDKAIAQVNLTMTGAKGTIRGMHFQHPPSAEKKLVMCIRGAVFDVAVDLRNGSKSFLKHYSKVLSAENHTALLIPEGCAHGFQALEDNLELLYLHSAFYNQPSEDGISPLDPLLAIPWPLKEIILSARDSSHPFITAEYKGVPV